MVKYAARRLPKFKTAGEGFRTIVVFGPPASGVSTVLSCLSQATRTPSVVLPYHGTSSIPDVNRYARQAEVVFLDVDGGLFGADDIQALVDARVIHAGNGAVVRLVANDEDVLKRADDRPNYVNGADLISWRQDVLDVEDRINTHSLKYFMIGNHDLESAVAQLAMRCGLSR